MTLPCTRDRVDIWLSWPDELREPSLLDRYRGLLSDQERARCDRFHFARDRHIYLVAHALVRCSLSRYAEIEPERWAFEHNAYGRPEVATGLTEIPLGFNLSHTRGLVACAVTRSVDVGVDVEPLDRTGATVELADRFFAPAEVRALRAVARAEQRERFLSYWTLKESYIKARGMGLSLPLDKVAFDLADQDAIAIAVDPALDDDGARWSFGLMRPRDRHMLAYAVRREPGRGRRGIDVRVHTTVPLG